MVIIIILWLLSLLATDLIIQGVTRVLCLETKTNMNNKDCTEWFSFEHKDVLKKIKKDTRTDAIQMANLFTLRLHHLYFVFVNYLRQICIKSTPYKDHSLYSIIFHYFFQHLRPYFVCQGFYIVFQQLNRHWSICIDKWRHITLEKKCLVASNGFDYEVQIMRPLNIFFNKLMVSLDVWRDEYGMIWRKPNLEHFWRCLLTQRSLLWLLIASKSTILASLWVH